MLYFAKDGSTTPKSTSWICPDCGRQFVSVNRNHSCGHFSLEDHFAGKEPVVRELFDFLLETMREFGSVSVFPVKTRIVLRAEVQFAAAMPRKRWLDGYSWLKRRLRTRAFDAWKWGFTAIMGIFSA
jgi:hypothetical protein